MASNPIIFRTHEEIEAEYGQRTPEQVAKDRAAVEFLKNIPEIEQRTKAWYEMREQKVTTSDWGTVLGVNKYESSPMSVLKKKCHMGAPFTGNEYTQYGVKYEPVACAIYEHRNRTKVGEYGLIPHPTVPFLGASPDGITDDGIMLEIKVPLRRALTGDPMDTKHYWVQMQGQLEVCDLERCDFLECKIDEILEEDYFALTPAQGEAGVVLTFEELDAGGKRALTYVYSDFFVGLDSAATRTTFNEWRERAVGRKIMTPGARIQPKYLGTSFWHLVQVSCVPIFRDREWFAEALPKLAEFWQKVQYVREHGLPPKLKYADIGNPEKHTEYTKKEEQRVLSLSKQKLSIEDFF